MYSLAGSKFSLHFLFALPKSVYIFFSANGIPTSPYMKTHLTHEDFPHASPYSFIDNFMPMNGQPWPRTCCDWSSSKNIPAGQPNSPLVHVILPPIFLGPSPYLFGRSGAVIRVKE